MAAKPKSDPKTINHAHHGAVSLLDREAPEGKAWAKCPDGQTRLLSLNLTDQ